MSLVSVVIATKDRPGQLSRLLQSVQSQDIVDFECIVVDDGSSTETLAKYDEIFMRMDDRFQLVKRAVSGGPSVARNDGVELSTSAYVAFCDDDDIWTRSDHLSVAVKALDGAGADLYIADMQTAQDGQVLSASWYAGLAADLKSAGTSTGTDIYPVGNKAMAKFLQQRILHANTLVIRRSLIKRIEGYWVRVRFAEDHDFCFRLADEANGIVFRATVCAELDVTDRPSLARSFSEQERLLFSILACTRIESIVQRKELRQAARANRAWRMLELSDLLGGAGHRAHAWEFAVGAAFVRPSSRALRRLWSLATVRN
jgi:glycosyltransferase involved in cell wall biosynthesis